MGSTLCTRLKNFVIPSSPPFKWIHLDIENLLTIRQLHPRSLAEGSKAYLRYDHVVATLVFRDLFINPVGGAKGHVVREEVLSLVLVWGD